MRRLVTAVLITVGLMVIAGCGSAQTHSVTTAVARTTGTIRVTALSGYAAQYPSTFPARFTKLCLSRVGERSACRCALRYVEANVPYRKVLAALPDITSDAKPSWYYGAVDACL